MYVIDVIPHHHAVLVRTWLMQVWFASMRPLTLCAVSTYGDFLDNATWCVAQTLINMANGQRWQKNHGTKKKDFLPKQTNNERQEN